MFNCFFFGNSKWFIPSWFRYPLITRRLGFFTKYQLLCDCNSQQKPSGNWRHAPLERDFTSFTACQHFSGFLFACCSYEWQIQNNAQGLTRHKRTFRRETRRINVNERKVAPFTSSKCWINSPAKPCQSKIVSSMTLSSVSHRNRLVCLPITSDQQSPVEKSILLFVCCCQKNWLSTPSVKVPKPSQNTPVRNKLTAFHWNLHENRSIPEGYQTVTY